MASRYTILEERHRVQSVVDSGFEKPWSRWLWEYPGATHFAIVGRTILAVFYTLEEGRAWMRENVHPKQKKAWG